MRWPRPSGGEGGWRVKPIEQTLEDAEDRPQLRRSMGTLGLTAFGVAAIIGSGIFVLSGVAAAEKAGPAIMLSFVAAAAVSGLAALCYAELAGCVPIAGSAYTYSYAVLGEVVAWIIGWDLILEYGVGAASVSNGWSGYLTDGLHAAFGVSLPQALQASPFAPHQPGIVNLPAIVILLALTGLLILGTKQASRFANVIVAFKVATVLFFVAIGIFLVRPGNWHPFFPFGIAGVGSGAALVFFAFIGFDEVSTAAEEARNPQRTMPRAILGSLVICTVLYVAVAAVLTGVVKYTELDNASPVAGALLQNGLNWAASIVSVGALAALTSVLLVFLFAQSRVFFSMARDGLLPRAFSAVHPQLRTPWMATLLVGLGAAVLGGLLPIQILAELSNIGTLFAFLLVALAVWGLRRAQPHLPRSFRVPWVPWIPIATAVACAALIVQLPGVTIVRFVIWLGIGLVLYALYGRRHSRLAAQPPTAGPR